MVCILGLDTVRTKTLYQTGWLARSGFTVDVLAMHRDTGSHTEDASARIVTLAPRPLKRVLQVLGYLTKHRADLHHVELYVGGRFAFVHALLTRLLRVPLLVVERGDILLVRKRVYSPSMRLSIRACYHLADRIWYRELYMGPLLADMGLSNTFLLPNAVPVPREPPARAGRVADVLWLNRLIPERRPEEFARALATVAARRPLSAAVVGLSVDAPAERVRATEEAVRKTLDGVAGVSLAPFGEPEPYYAAARFFVLHGEIVFANFALLEAMARGVVPIVSDVEGADRIVEDGRNGILYPPCERGLEQALHRALDASDDQWERWSHAARETVLDRYSIEAWGAQLIREYRRFGPCPPGPNAVDAPQT